MEAVVDTLLPPEGRKPSHQMLKVRELLACLMQTCLYFILRP